MSTINDLVAQVTEINTANGWHDYGDQMVTPDSADAQIAALLPMLGTLVKVIEVIRLPERGDLQTLLRNMADTADNYERFGLERAVGAHLPDVYAPLATSRTVTLSRLMLIITEVAEAGEAVLETESDAFLEECADIAIRLFGVIGVLNAQGNNFDLEAAILAKLEKNRERGYRYGGKRA